MVVGATRSFLNSGTSDRPVRWWKRLHDVRRQRRIARQQPDIGIEPRRLDVIVAGADVGVRAQAGALFPNHQRDLRVGLQRHVADGDVGAGPFELRGPVEVALLVKPRLQLDHAGDLLAALRPP